MAGSSFFVFLAFIRMLIRFSDIKMESIFASSRVFLFCFCHLIINQFFQSEVLLFCVFLYHSGESCEDTETNLLFFSVVLSSRRMLQVFQACVSFLFSFVRLSLSYTWWQAWKSGWKYWFEMTFRTVHIMQKIGVNRAFFWKSTYSLKIIHRNWSFQSYSSSIGILIISLVSLLYYFTDSFTVRNSGPSMLHTCFFIQ